MSYCIVDHMGYVVQGGFDTKKDAQEWFIRFLEGYSIENGD